VHRLLELLLIEELQDEENQLPAKRRHGSPDPSRSLQLSKTRLNLGPSRQIPPKSPAKPARNRPKSHSKQAKHPHRAQNLPRQPRSPNPRTKQTHNRSTGLAAPIPPGSPPIPSARPPICSCRRRRLESGRQAAPTKGPASNAPPSARVWPRRRRCLRLHTSAPAAAFSLLISRSLAYFLSPKTSLTLFFSSPLLVFWTAFYSHLEQSPHI
jgi:hypothetical protein